MKRTERTGAAIGIAALLCIGCKNPTASTEGTETSAPPSAVTVQASARQTLDIVPGAKLLAEQSSERRSRLKVSVPRSTTRDQLADFMVQLYREQMARRDFRNGAPDGVHVAVFLEGTDWENAPNSYVGFIRKPPAAAEPDYENRLMDASLVAQVRSVMKKVSGGVSVEALDKNGVRVNWSMDDEHSAFGEPLSRKEVVANMGWAATFAPGESVRAAWRLGHP